jgi:hypothetical protein
MARLVHVFNQAARTEVFSKWKERFVISDGWVIKQASTSNVLSILSGFGAEGIKGAYEVDVNIGWAEVNKSCFDSQNSVPYLYPPAERFA